jgi:hypothetical protein
MSKDARKAYKMGAKQFVTLMSQTNNYIPFFPNATVLSKYSEEELLNILEFAVPPHWRKAFDMRNYLPTSDNKARFISECEPVEQNKTPPAKERDSSDNDRTSNKKSKFAKSEKSVTKSGKKTNTESGPTYCTHCKTDTHVTERCWKLKKIAWEKELSEKKSPYLKRTFRKEVDPIARRAGKNGNIKLVEKTIKRKQGKHRKKKRNTQKWPVQKRLSLATQTPLMSPLTLWSRVKGFGARRDMRSVLSNLTPGVIKSTSKILIIQMMIAKCLLKSAVKNLKKVADPMDTKSSEETDEDEDFKASKEEKAFLKTTDKKENSGTDSD